MEQDSQAGSESPNLASLRSEASVSQVEEVEPSSTNSTAVNKRKKKKRKEPRPESIIVYHSEMERAPSEEQGTEGEEERDRASEEGAKFLATPTGEGEVVFAVLLLCRLLSCITE